MGRHRFTNYQRLTTRACSQAARVHRFP